MKQDQVREKLIAGTICVIARDGLDKATTKQIGIETAINEAYIYRCFKDKKDMFAHTFDSLDEELVCVVSASLPAMEQTDVRFETRCQNFFLPIWKFLLSNREKCLTYVRYYYSPYYQKLSAEKHWFRFKSLVEVFRPAFRERANIWMLLNHILATMLDFAIKVYGGAVPDNDDTAYHVFRLLYASVSQYLKPAR